MPNIIELNLLSNKSIVATMQGYPLANENSYKIIAGEENATKFIIKSIPNQYANARLTVEMVNSQGLGIAERELSEIEVDLVSYKGFILPVGMAVAGYSYVSIKAYLDNSSTTIENGTVSVDYTKLAPCKAYTFIYNGSAWELNKNVVNLSTYGITISGTPKENDIIQVREKVVFQPLKIKVWNTISQWQDYVDKTANVKVVDGYLILTENGNEYNLGYVRGEKGEKGDKGEKGIQGETGATGAKLISQELVGQDENGGNIYQQTFDDGTVAYFTAPRGEASTEEGEDLLTKTEADETYLPIDISEQSRQILQYVPVIQPFNDGTKKVRNYAIMISDVTGWGVITSSGGLNLAINGASNENIDGRTNRSPIQPGSLDYVVKVGVTGYRVVSGVGTYGNQIALTDAEKEAAQTWLGIEKTYCHLITLTCQNGYARLTVYNKSAVQFTRDTLKEYLAQVGAHSSNHWSGVVQNGVIYPASGCIGINNDGYYIVFGVHWDSYDSNNSAIRITGGKQDALYGEMATDVEDTVTEL